MLPLPTLTRFVPGGVTGLVPGGLARLGVRAVDGLPPVVARRVPAVVGQLATLPGARQTLSRLAINHYASAAPPRPRPLTLGADYTTWRGLTDRTWTGRHLPPAPPEETAALPDAADVVALFRREQMSPSSDTSVLFMFFAQWFTDSFLRTSRDDPRRNTSNHEIDLCQLYGLAETQTQALRAHSGGRLKSQILDGEEYPEFLFEPRDPGGQLVVKPEFADLHDETFLVEAILGGASEAHQDTVFAVGLEHGNSTIGQTTMNVVFLREHNRIAGVLAAEHPDWDDDRLFETTRNVMIVLVLKLVVEEYIRHIAPFDVPVQLVPFLADDERWNRSNWCAIEFNLLYRWHSLAPDGLGSGTDALTAGQLVNNNPLVIERGTDAVLTLCSRERSGRIGLRNTPAFLVDRSAPDRPSVEERSVALMRSARLRSFNDYREAFGLPRLRRWEQLTSDVSLRERLQELYGDVDSLEWYVGIFAEDYPEHRMMGELLTTMVAHDAFTQALTNPLLGRQVFTEATFSAAGMRIIAETGSLAQIVARTSADPDEVEVSFRC